MASNVTPVGMLSFPNLFKPRPRTKDANAEAVYSCTLILDANAQRDPLFKMLQNAVDDAIDLKFGAGKSKDRAFVAKLRSPFRSCEEKDYSGYDVPDGIFINAWSKQKPGLIDARKNDIYAPEDVFPGQLARISVSAFGYDVSGNRGVGFGLNNVQICKSNMPRLDGRKAARQEFDDYDDGDAENEDIF